MSSKRKAEGGKERGNKGRKVQFSEKRQEDEPDSVEDEGEEEFDEKEDFSSGYKVEPFNMREEREEGRFDETSGSYSEKSYTSRRSANNEAFLRGEKIRRRTKRNVEEDEPDEDEEGKDAWLEEYDEQVETFAAAGRKYPVAKPKPVEELEESVKPVDQTALRSTLLQHLQPGETVTAALRRLGNSSSNKSKKKTKAPSSKEPFDIVTEAADQLLSVGYYDVYTDKREQIEKSTQSHNPKTVSVSQKPKVMWEYKTNGEVYGPYTNDEMLAWKEQGYFADNSVLTRKVNVEDIFSDETEFVPCDQVDFTQYA